MAFVSSKKVYAEESSIAIGGDNHGTLTLNSGLAETQFEILSKKIDSISPPPNDASEVLIRDAIDQELNLEIDNLTNLIKQRKPLAALDLFNNLYERVASSSSGKIRFRIKANIGICHLLIGNKEKAADFLLDAYLQAPNEPKAISNKALALLLKSKPELAFEFGKIELEKNHLNEALAGYLIQASRAISSVTAPLDLIPQNLHNSSNVIVGNIHFLQHRGKYSEWWKAAHSGLELYPDDSEIKKYAALADMEEVLIPEKINFNHNISPEQKLKLSAAANVLFEFWDLCRDAEASLSEDDKINVINLSNLFHVLHNTQELVKLCNQAAEKCPNDADFMDNISKILLQSNQIEALETILSKFNPGRISSFILFAVAQSKGDLKYLSNANDSDIETFPLSEQVISKIIVELAKLSESKKTISEYDFQPLLEMAGNGVRELLVITHEAQKHQFNEIAEVAFDRACKNINLQSNIADRIMLAREAYFREEWQTVINCLYGYISTHIYNDNFRYLAIAFANNLPVQEAAICFFENLPVEIASISQIKTLSGVLFHNQGDLKNAESILLSELNSNPSNLNAFRSLISTYVRQNKENEIRDLVALTNPKSMTGQPVFMMQLAHLLKKYGRESEALELGYQILSENPDNQEVIPLYMGLMLLEKDDLIPSTDKVEKGYCIQLTSQAGDHFEYLYDDKSVSHIPIKNLKHPLIAASIDKSLGDVFEQVRNGLPPVAWTITSIKHKYIHALQTNLDQFEMNFPESNALFKVSLPDDNDISSILDLIKADGEKKQKALENYLKNQLPLAILARTINRECNSVSVAQELIRNNIRIYTNSGLIKELESAIELLEKNTFDAIVLDFYTTWHLAVCDLFPTFLKVFQNLIVPQSVLDEIRFLAAEFDNSNGSEKMTIGWHKGQFQRHTLSEEESQNQLAYINKQRDKVLEYCKVETPVWREQPNEIVSKVMDIAGMHFWDSAILSQQTNRLLLSDDMFFRLWATSVFDLKSSIWIDAILRYCYKLKLITVEALIELIAHQSAWNHFHISLTPEILTNGLEMDKSENLIEFSKLCKYIGYEEVDFPSHVGVVKAFLQLIWITSKIDKSRLIQASHLILDNLFRFSRNKAMSLVILYANAPVELDECIIDWREQNGISDEELANAYIAFETSQDPISLF